MSRHSQIHDLHTTPAAGDVGFPVGERNPEGVARQSQRGEFRRMRRIGNVRDEHTGAGRRDDRVIAGERDLKGVIGRESAAHLGRLRGIRDIDHPEAERAVGQIDLGAASRHALCIACRLQTPVSTRLRWG